MKTKSRTAKKQIKQRIRNRRPIHKRFLLHPAILFLLLCVGVTLLIVSVQALADSLTVTAKVSAPLPDSPAVIQTVAPMDQPTQTQAAAPADSVDTAIHVSDNQVLLNGECPADSHIEFYRNNIFAGVASCIGDPTFSIEINLVNGLNLIVGRVFNITDDEGPISQNLYVYYDIPTAPVVSSPVTGTNPATSTNPQPPSVFLLYSDFRYLGFYTNQKASWNLSLKGGVAPYTFNMDWGDGKKSTLIRPDATPFAITHTYTKASTNTGYTITVSVTDASGNKAVMQLLTIISNTNTHTAGQIAVANENLNPSLFKQLQRWLVVAWPAYIVLALMSVSFWLGEREEYSRLVNRIKSKRR